MLKSGETLLQPVFKIAVAIHRLAADVAGYFNLELARFIIDIIYGFIHQPESFLNCACAYGPSSKFCKSSFPDYLLAVSFPSDIM